MTIGGILSKAPCNADYFDGKSHELLAKVIAGDIINDPNCTIIGIDGGWGSGKSNLVGIVKKCLTKENPFNLKPHKEFHFFSYDAWGHQSDLPRRSILEELTADLTLGDDAILDKDIWAIKLENLLSKKKKTSTKIVPSINFAIVTIALLVALTPVISIIADTIPMACGKLIFTVFFYTAAILFVIIKQLNNMKKNGQIINCESFFSELFLLYKDKIKEDEKYEIISEREPSTKQFKDWMVGIDNDLKLKNKRLVIVIDNMDRLPRLKVQELWAAIHSFFSEKHYDNIKVIVPFDRLHIRSAFQSENINNNQQCSAYGDDFINKTFYIIYHVAPPILSSWKQYFEYQWKIAFGKDSSVDNAILQVYDLLTIEHTPRKIVAFINEFVTIKKIADPKIPDKYIALFIFGRYEISRSPIKEILMPSYLGALEFLYKDDKNMPGYISSLYYQLPVDDAMDIVYTRQFTRELDENTPNSILMMKESKNNKFTAILEHAITDVSNTINATMAFESIFGNEKSLDAQNLWECLYMKDKDVRGEIKQYMPYQKTLLSHINNNRNGYLKDLIQGYHNSFTEETIVEDYISGIDELAEVDDIDIYSKLRIIKKEISPRQFVSLIENVGGKYKQYGLYVTDNELSTYLGALSIADWGKLSILPSLNRDDYPLDSFKEAISLALRNTNIKVSDAKILFSRLKELRKNKLINYHDYFSDSILENLFHNATDDFVYDAIAMRLSALTKFSAPNNYFNNELNRTNDNDLIERVANVCYNYVSYGSLLTAIDTFKYPLVKDVCKYLTVNRIGCQSMDIKSVAEKFDIITSNSNIAKDELFFRMNDWIKYKESIKEEDIPDLPLDLFETAKENNCELSTYLLSLTDDYLQSISQENWISYLKTNNNFQLNLLELHHTIQLQPFFDAFKSVMKMYASGELQDCLNQKTVERLIDISKEIKHDVRGLFIDIRDIFLNSSITNAKLKYFGEWLFEYANMTQKSGCLDKILPSELLDDEDIIIMMNRNRDDVKEMIERSNNATEFISKLKAMALGNRKGNTELIELCNYIDIFSESNSYKE